MAVTNPFTLATQGLPQKGKKNSIESAYSNLANQGYQVVSSDFWGTPVLKLNDGSLFCPGFVGKTFLNDESPWNSVYISAPLAQPYTPGLVEVTVDKSRKADVKEIAGADGASVTYSGISPSRVEFRITIWTPDQFEALKRLWAILFPAPQKEIKQTTTPNGQQQAVTIQKVQPYDMSHPMLNIHKIKSLVMLSASGPDPGNIPRSRVFTMRAIEFIQVTKDPVNTTTTPKASKHYAPTPSVVEKQYQKPGDNVKNTGP